MLRKVLNKVLTNLLLVGFISCLVGCAGDPQSVGSGGFIPGDRNVLIINGLGETLTAIDIADMTVHNNMMTLGKWPNYLTSDEDRHYVYVVNSGDNQVMEIDAHSGVVKRRLDIGIGRNPWGCEIVGAMLWVTNLLNGEVTVIDLNTGNVSARVQIGGTPQAVHIHDGVVYVTDTAFQYGSFGRGRVVAIDADSRAELFSCHVGKNPQDLLVDESGRLHVVCSGSYSMGDEHQGEIHVIDATTLTPLDTLELGGSPSAICAGSGGMIYTAGYWGGVLVYDANTLEVQNDLSSPLLQGDGFMDIEFDASSGLLFLADFDDDRVTVLDQSSGQVVSRLGVGDGPVRILIFEPGTARAIRTQNTK